MDDYTQLDRGGEWFGINVSEIGHIVIFAADEAKAE